MFNNFIQKCGIIFFIFSNTLFTGDNLREVTKFFNTASSSQLLALKQHIFLSYFKNQTLSVNKNIFFVNNSQQRLYPTSCPVEPLKKPRGHEDYSNLYSNLSENNEIVSNVQLKINLPHIFDIHNEKIHNTIFLHFGTESEFCLFDGVDKNQCAVAIQKKPDWMMTSWITILFGIDQFFQSFCQLEYYKEITSLCMHQRDKDKIEFSVSKKTNNQYSFSIYSADIDIPSQITSRSFNLTNFKSFQSFKKHKQINQNLFVALDPDGQLYFVSINHDNTIKSMPQKVKKLKNSSEYDSFVDFAVNDDEDKRTATGTLRFLVALNVKRQLFFVDLFGYYNLFKLIYKFSQNRYNHIHQYKDNFDHAKISFYKNFITVFNIQTVATSKLSYLDCSALCYSMPAQSPFYRIILPTDFHQNIDKENIFLLGLQKMEQAALKKEKYDL
jgi:hypothetical protein